MKKRTADPPFQNDEKSRDLTAPAHKSFVKTAFFALFHSITTAPFCQWKSCPAVRLFTINSLLFRKRKMRGSKSENGWMNAGFRPHDAFFIMEKLFLPLRPNSKAILCKLFPLQISSPKKQPENPCCFLKALLSVMLLCRFEEPFPLPDPFPFPGFHLRARKDSQNMLFFCQQK